MILASPDLHSQGYIHTTLTLLGRMDNEVPQQGMRPMSTMTLGAEYLAVEGPSFDPIQDTGKNLLGHSGISEQNRDYMVTIVDCKF